MANRDLTFYNHITSAPRLIFILECVRSNVPFCKAGTLIASLSPCILRKDIKLYSHSLRIRKGIVNGYLTKYLLARMIPYKNQMYINQIVSTTG